MLPEKLQPNSQFSTHTFSTFKGNCNSQLDIYWSTLHYPCNIPLLKWWPSLIKSGISHFLCLIDLFFRPVFPGFTGYWHRQHKLSPHNWYGSKRQEHLSYKDRLEVMRLFSLERRVLSKENSLQPSNTLRRLIKRRDRDFLCRQIVTGQQ